MPVVNIELENDQPPVMLTVSAENLPRFMAFLDDMNKVEKRLDEADRVINALYESGELKTQGERLVQDYIRL